MSKPIYNEIYDKRLAFVRSKRAMEKGIYPNILIMHPSKVQRLYEELIRESETKPHCYAMVAELRNNNTFMGMYVVAGMGESIILSYDPTGADVNDTVPKDEMYVYKLLY